MTHLPISRVPFSRLLDLPTPHSHVLSGTPPRPLRSGYPAASMSLMFLLRKKRRRLVAGALTVFLLACQSGGISYGRVPDPQQTLAPADACHESGQQEGNKNSRDGCHAICQAQLSPPAQSANPCAVVELHAMAARQIGNGAGKDLTLPRDPPFLRAEPPPLLILHCCLRN
jgi:hypothetical protein